MVGPIACLQIFADETWPALQFQALSPVARDNWLRVLSESIDTAEATHDTVDGDIAAPPLFFDDFVEPSLDSFVIDSLVAMTHKARPQFRSIPELPSEVESWLAACRIARSRADKGSLGDLCSNLYNAIFPVCHYQPNLL